MKKKIFPENVWLIKLEDKATLEGAVEYLRLYPPLYPKSYNIKAPSAHLIIYWNDREGLKYLICFNSFFITKESALKSFSSLDSAVYSAGEVVVLKTEETVFFSNPGFVLLPSGAGIGEMRN